MITLNVKSKRAKKMERLIKQLITITLPFNYLFGKVILLEKSECLMNCLENFKSWLVLENIGRCFLDLAFKVVRG